MLRTLLGRAPRLGAGREHACGRPTGGPALPHLLPGGSSVVEQWTVKCSMQRSIGREFKSPSPDLFLFARLRPAVYRGGGEQAGIFGLVGYDARFTRERSRVRSSEDVVSFFFFHKFETEQRARALAQHSWFGHIRVNTAHPIRTANLSTLELDQYCSGGPCGNLEC